MNRNEFQRMVELSLRRIIADCISMERTKEIAENESHIMQISTEFEEEITDETKNIMVFFDMTSNKKSSNG